jgi:hypothetical protein
MKNQCIFRPFFSIIFVVFVSVTALAVDPVIWTMNSRAEALKGDAKGVSISETGAITLAPKLTQAFNTDQSYVWSSAVDAAGNTFLGTGSDGKIFRVDAAGNGKLYADLAELNVSALATGRDGALYAGTSPDGKVYRIAAEGKAESYFEPKEKYIWSLAVLGDGSLAVGTGEAGKLYRVRAAGARAEDSLAFDSSETHIISLAADKQANLYAGTDPGGVVLRFGADMKAFAVLDTPLREIHEIAVGPDGSAYALALSDSASSGSGGSGSGGGSGPNPPPAAGPTPPQDDPNAPPLPPRSKNDLNNVKSAVFRILPDGGNETIWTSPSVTGFALYAHQTGNGVLIGTSEKGRIYNVTNDGRETLVLQSNEGQISTIRSAGNSLIATSSNQGKLFRIGPDTAAEGSYESTVRDARSTAAWGRIWWRGSGVEVQTRSGNTEKPDETWSAWSAAQRDPKGAAVMSPKARYLQWRAVLRGATTALSEVSVSYLGRNIAPEVLAIGILPGGVALQPNMPPMPDPSIDNSGLDPALFGGGGPIGTPGGPPPRRFYQRGARSLQWMAEDRNNDKLEFAVFYREVGEANFHLLREGVRDAFFTFDGLSLPDGNYVFKVVASDAPSNPNGMALAADRVSEAVEIDNTAPSIRVTAAPAVAGDKARFSFEANDTGGTIRRAEYSLNGAAWETVFADDGISDSGRETYTVELPARAAGEHIVAIRVFDQNGNGGTTRIVIRK